MSGLILPNRFTSQPQYPAGIDWSNPLTLGLLGAISASSKDGTIVGAPAFEVSSAGVALKTNGSTLISKTVASPISSATLLIVGNAVNSASANSFLSSFGTNSGGNQTFVIQPPSSGLSPLRALIRVANGGGVSTRESATYVGNTDSIIDDHVFAAVYYGTSSIDLYLDGKLDNGTTANTAASGNVTALDNIALGGIKRGTNGYSTGIRQHLALGFNRALSASEIKSLSANPWQIFKSQQRRIWVGAAGGTNTAVNPGTGTIAITGYAPSVAQTANQAITPNVGNIVITGYTPTISQPQAVNPGVGSLTITGYAPTVTQNVDVPVNPGVGTIAITGYAPTVAQTANQSVLPATGTIAITGYSPAVSQTANQAITPDVGTITVTGYAPIVQQAPASQNITPDVGTITITGYAPTVEQSSPLRLGGFEYGSKVYIKRNKKIYIFDSVEEADSYLEAEAKAEEIVQQSNRTSRLARKRAREKAFKSLAIEPVESVDIPALKTLVAQLQTDFELPKLIAQQDWQRVVEIYNQAMEMQDEEDLLLIL